MYSSLSKKIMEGFEKKGLSLVGYGITATWLAQGNKTSGFS